MYRSGSKQTPRERLIASLTAASAQRLPAENLSSPSKRRRSLIRPSFDLSPCLPSFGSASKHEQSTLNSFPVKHDSQKTNASATIAKTATAEKSLPLAADLEPETSSSSPSTVTSSDNGTCSQNSTAPSDSSQTTNTVDSASILEGVTAFLDVRTEDGDDVSHCFERTLHAMGAKTRRTFTESVTHLIYKDGSAMSLRKALSKKIPIVNLLWVTHCKREGRRLPVDEYLVGKPQGIISAGKKRRKSMEPGIVKPLLSSQSSNSAQDTKTKRTKASQAVTRLSDPPKPVSIDSSSEAEREAKLRQRRKTVGMETQRALLLKKNNAGRGLVTKTRPALSK